MQLSLMTWPELEPRLARGACIMLPVGSTEQHGPMGLIGTDTICAHEVAVGAARECDGIVAPALPYTPAPFNTAFPGTVSVTADLFGDLLSQVCTGLLAQGFEGVFIVNGHGANLEPAHAVAASLPAGAIHIQSWYDPAPVTALRSRMFGDWEGMHATPSEIALTQVFHGPRPAGAAIDPPEKLSPAYIRAHRGDRHGPPDQHRARFPDGRVGSHSALATPELGRQILTAATRALAEDFQKFEADRRTASRPG